MPGSTPRLISGWPNFAVVAAMRMSPIIASSQPPPRAYPPTAVMTGLRTFVSRSQPANQSARYAVAKSRSAISLMSAPAAKAFSLPVMMIARTASSASKAVAASVMSVSTWRLSALRAFGRSIVIVATPSAVFVRIVAKSLMRTPSLSVRR